MRIALGYIPADNLPIGLGLSSGRGRSAPAFGSSCVRSSRSVGARLRMTPMCCASPSRAMAERSGQHPISLQSTSSSCRNEMVSAWAAPSRDPRECWAADGRFQTRFRYRVCRAHPGSCGRRRPATAETILMACDRPVCRCRHMGRALWPSRPPAGSASPLTTA